MVKLKYIARNLIIFYIVALFLVLIGCSDEKEKVKLKVTCSDSSDPSFSGWYTPDGDDDVTFLGSESEDVSTIYTYEVTLKDVDDLDVWVTKTSDSATLIVRIYQGDDLKQSEQNDPESSTHTIHVTYEYEDDDSDSDDDDTTDTDSD